MGWLEALHDTLDKRVMPEDVARIILNGAAVARAGLSGDGLVELRRVATARSPWWVSSMSDDFERVPDCSAQLAVVARLCGVDVAHVAPASPEQVRSLINAQGAMLGGWKAGSDWKADRLPKDQRAAFRVALAVPHPALASKRQYNRAIRSLRHLEDKRQRMEHACEIRRLILTGRSGFAWDIPLERFAADPATACFIAYYAARKNKRRIFSLQGKENPVDRLAQALLGRLAAPRHFSGGGTDWEMLAWAYPQPEVLARLTDEQRGALMGRWWAVMRDTAAMLERAWPSEVSKLSMIVRLGMDSSTWNTMAQAYNAARAGWINCAVTSGAGALLDPFCPGKVMRLMAADLAYWHASSGGDVDPDTEVWAFLPMPWDVISGKMPCTRADVEAACAQAGVDPAARGWTAPRAKGEIAGFTPTPELVHGVEVADPAWAALLRRAGVFSGKGIRPDMAHEVAVIPEGVVTGALPVYAAGGKYVGST
jgi:hypothetical protein